MKSETKLMNFKISVDERHYIRKLSDEVLNKKQAQDLILSLDSSDSVTPKYFFDHAFRTHIPNRESWSIDNALIEEDALSYYTDGSKTRNGTGFGIHGPFNISRHYISSRSKSHCCMCEGNRG